MKAIISILFLLVKFEIVLSQVTQEWVARYSGPVDSSNFAFSIAVDNSGNTYVTGNSRGMGTDADYATLKYNQAGVQQWVTRYNGPGNWFDIATFIALDGLGNVYVTGFSVGIGTYTDYTTIKYNSAGLEQWVARYSGTGNGEDRPYSIAIDNSGNVYVTGFSIDSLGSTNYATIKYNSAGIQQWVAIYNGPESFANSIAVDGSGNVFVTGESYGSSTGHDYATVKYNAAGIQQWVIRYNGPGNDWDAASKIVLDNSDNIYVTGFSYGSGTSYDYATIKYNSSGVQQWVARYNGTENSSDNARSIAVDGSGNVFVTGQSAAIGTNTDYATIKYNSSGAEQWVVRYNNGAASSIALDNSDNVYVTGGS